jgi:TrpR-related protein YerC/YecD
VNPKLKTPESALLCRAVLSLASEEECMVFFEDILTAQELQSIAQRLTVARMLDDGQTYEDIARVSGASSATISRVKRALAFGADGYRIVLDRFENA